MEDRIYKEVYEESTGSALLNLFLFSGFMFTVPIAAFFLSKQYLEDNYHLEAPYNQLAPAIISIFLVNVIIMAYVWRAFRVEAQEKASNPNQKPIEERKKRE